jgi:hypothetical protein
LKSVDNYNEGENLNTENFEKNIQEMLRLQQDNDKLTERNHKLEN